MITHKFDKAKYEQMKKDHDDAKANPKIDTLQGLKVRVANIENILEVV